MRAWEKLETQSEVRAIQAYFKATLTINGTSLQMKKKKTGNILSWMEFWDSCHEVRLVKLDFMAIPDMGFFNIITGDLFQNLWKEGDFLECALDIFVNCSGMGILKKHRMGRRDL